MGTFRIRCVVIDREKETVDHTAIKEVGVGSTRYSVRRIAEWIDEGVHAFYTTNKDGQHRRPVTTCRCEGRPGLHIRSEAGDRTDNHLAAQTGCPWV